ncbi:hypothetical protein [Arthrobacter sp. Marseille-P9274]|uniref:hypothetical protein n=1 Tax=Arthrobacter sp. Marseille-P9274 TaxID=2866572 RepID=UPI0021C9F25A|nr:hypothetical protein [Arthrobacter sp. Marseille-P9274]
MFLVMLLGLVLITVSATYAVRHPRAKDEAFSSERKLYLALSIIGGACVLFYAIPIFMTE